MNTANIKENDKNHVLYPWAIQKNIVPKVIARAEGVFFWDDAERRYFDMSSQLVYQNVGHQHPKLLQAFKQIGDYPIAAPAFATKPRADLAKKIIDVAPSSMKKVFFTCGGAESNDHAIKIARMATGRYKIFSRYRSYHGATFGAGNLTGENRRFSVEPGLPGFIKFDIPYLYREVIDFPSEEAATNYYLARLKNQILHEGSESIAAIFIEPIPGSNGVLIPPKGYLEGVRALCDEYGILMICDEVMTGFGRTGKMFAVDHFDFEPDMMTFAKGVTSGYAPLGGVIVNEKVANVIDEMVLLTGLTYSGHTMCTQIGSATLDLYKEEKLIENAEEMGSVLAERLNQLVSFKSVGEVRHIGLFAAVELVKDKETKEPIVTYGTEYGKDPVGLMRQMISLLAANGFYTYAHDSIIIIAPPLVITKQQIHEAMDIFEQTLTTFENEYLYADKTLVV